MTSTYTPTYTPRERALFGEIAEAESLLAEALGFPPKRPGQPGYSPHHKTFDTGENSIVTLSMAAAEAIHAARNGGPGTDVAAIRAVADTWAGNIEEWLRTGDEAEARSTDYAEGFADGWSHALKILRSLTDAAAAVTAVSAPGETC